MNVLTCIQEGGQVSECEQFKYTLNLQLFIALKLEFTTSLMFGYVNWLCDFRVVFSKEIK